MPANNRRKTIEEFKDWVSNTIPEYTCLSSIYVNNKTHVRMRHSNCGYEWDVRPDQLVRGRRCPSCFGTRLKTKEAYQADLDKKFGLNEFKLVGEYISNSIGAKIRHTCGYEWSPLPRDMLAKNRTNGCFSCNGTPLKTYDDYIKQVKDLVGDEYTVISTEYKTTNDKMTFRHNSCGTEFSMRSSAFVKTYGHRCPACSKPYNSRGSQLIASTLKILDLQFIQEKSFKDCISVGGKLLRFDFYIPSLDILIEYDGRQHYEPVSYLGGETGFKRLVANDAIKNKYCIDNNITLIRIPYFRESYIKLDLMKEINSARSKGGNCNSSKTDPSMRPHS
jgi:hypothetical protein